MQNFLVLTIKLLLQSKNFRRRDFPFSNVQKFLYEPFSSAGPYQTF